MAKTVIVKPRYKKRKYVKKRPAPVVSKVVRSKVFKRKVQRIVNKNLETKVINYRANDKNLLNVASADWVGTVLNMIPGGTGGNNMFTISQGDGQGQRTGNQITPKGLYLRGIIRVAPGYDPVLNYNPCPMYVTMYVARLKQHLSDSSTELETVIDNTVFQNGSTSLGMSGLPNDLLNTFNSDQITLLYKRVFKVGYAQYVSGFGVNAPANVYQQFANNDFKLMRMFKINLSKLLPKKMKFNDSTDICTNTRKLWLFFCVTREDNIINQTSTGSYTGPVPAECELSADFYYKDG